MSRGADGEVATLFLLAIGAGYVTRKLFDSSFGLVPTNALVVSEVLVARSRLLRTNPAVEVDE
jgi:hypothetical protein